MNETKTIINNTLMTCWDFIPKNTTTNKMDEQDIIIIIDGDERSGMSNTSIQIVKYLNNNNKKQTR